MPSVALSPFRSYCKLFLIITGWSSPIHKSSSVVTPAQFEDLFPEIGMHLDREAFRRHGWPVHIRTVTSPAQLGEAFSCFRLSCGRVDPHFLHWLFARNMTVREAQKRYRALRKEDRKKCDAFEQIFRDQGHASFALPAYDLGNGRVLVLDGNHRCLALCRSGVPFQLTLYVVTGPLLDSACGDVSGCREGWWPPR